MWPVLLFSLLLSLTATADDSVTAKIYDIDYGKNGEPSFLLLTSGHVVWLKKPSLKSKTGLFALAKLANKTINFKLDANNALISSKAVRTASRETQVTEALFFDFDDLYAPTIVESLDKAKEYFNEGRDPSGSSQCFNRAHVWSYEWYKNHSVLSNKTWVFFTRRYIRENDTMWWFHVAPSMAVQEGDVVREKVMDVTFSSEPTNVPEWTRTFMRDSAPCPRVKKFSDYANYPESESCYTMRTSMFYHQPIDLENLENKGWTKINWVIPDLQAAYLETFDEVF